MSSADDGGRSFDVVLDVSESDGDASAACLDGSPASELADCSSRVCVSAAASAAPCETASSGGVRDGPEESGVADGTGNDGGAGASAEAAASVFGEGRVRCTAAPGIGLDARCVEAPAQQPEGNRCTRLEGRCVGAAGAGADATGAAASKSIRLLLTEQPAAASGCIFDGSEPRRILSARWVQKGEPQTSGMDDSESESEARRASDGNGGSS